MDLIIFFFAVILIFLNKYDLVLLALFTLVTNYFGVGSNISTFPIIHNVSDSGLILYIILSLVLLWKNKYQIPKNKITFYVSLFYVFLLFSIFIDLFFNDIDLISIFKTSRHWIFLSSVWILFYVPKTTVERLLKYLLNITLVMSILLLLEFFTDLNIFNRSMVQMTQSGLISKRGAIPSTFTIVFILLLYSDYFKFNARNKYIYLSVLIIVLIVSMIRSWIIASIIGLIIVHVRCKIKIKKGDAYKFIFIFVLFFTLVFSNSFIKTRFLEGFSDVANINLNGDVQGTFSYRIFHTKERLDYISSDIKYSIIGIGNITEKNSNTNFQFGVLDENARPTQLDTGDIAWSRLFLRLGIIGTFIYLSIVFILIKEIKLFIKMSLLSINIYSFLIIELFMISFVSSELANGSFILLPILIYYYIKNYDSKTISNNSNSIVQSR